MVFGAGPVGLSFVKLGKLFGLGQVDIVDMLPAKLELAKQMGADNGYTPRVKRIGIPDTFIEHGSIPELYKLCGLNAESLAGEIRKMMND